VKERDHSKNLGVDRRIILNKFSRDRVEAQSGLIWFRIGTGGGLL
jgi:hypothetical protein